MPKARLRFVEGNMAERRLQKYAEKSITGGLEETHASSI